MTALREKEFGVPTSFSKLAFVNSSEFKSALVAASRTLLLVSSFRIPCIMAVRISLDWLAKNLGSYGGWMGGWQA
jgi:hypothetical protein